MSIDLADFEDTDLALEARRISAVEPTEAVSIAGLQFHDFGRPDGLDGTVQPQRGDRLQLVREPENPADENAVGVWWRNSYRIGHLPRAVAADVAAGMDAGESLRAYLTREGDGSPWSAKLLLIGSPVRLIHEADARWEARRQALCGPIDEYAF